jgi:hypothetical protein
LRKKSLCILLGFRILFKIKRHINKILKIQSNEQKNVSTIEKKRRNKHGLWTEWLLQMEEKFLRVEEQKDIHN